MLTRFNLGSIPSTAKSTLGLKIKMVRTRQICHDSFFCIFWIGGGRERVLGESIYFLVNCVSRNGSLISAKSEWAVLPWYVFDAYLGQWSLPGWTVTSNSQQAGADSLLRGQGS